MTSRSHQGPWDHQVQPPTPSVGSQPYTTSLSAHPITPRAQRCPTDVGFGNRMGNLGTGASALAGGHGGHRFLGATNTVFGISTPGLPGWRIPTEILACPRLCIFFLKMGILSTKQDVAALKSHPGVVSGHRVWARCASVRAGPQGSFLWTPVPQKFVFLGFFFGCLHPNPTCSEMVPTLFPKTCPFLTGFPIPGSETQ